MRRLTLPDSYNRSEGFEPIARFEKVFLIYNPVAGKLLRHPDQFQQAVSHLREQYRSLEVLPTTGPGAASELARQSRDAGADLVIVAGGDGTLNEALHGLAGSDVTCGVLPGGTANVLAVEVGIGGNLRRAAQRLSGWTPVSVPLGRLIPPSGPPRYFLLMAGAGLDAVIVNRVSTPLKRRYGKLAYWTGGFSLLGQKLQEFEVVVNGSSYRASFALASRVKNYGGDLTIAYRANLLEPEFDVVLFEGTSTFRYLKYFAAVLLRLAGTVNGVHRLRTDRLELRPLNNGIPIQLDGEAAGELPAHLEIASESLNMLVPPAFIRANQTVRVAPQPSLG